MISYTSSTEKKLEVLKSELNNENLTNQKIKAEINQTVESNDMKIAQIEKQIEKLRDEIRKTKGERLALEYLVKKGHIEFNELKIINTLEGRKTTDVATISKVTGLSESLITKTLNGLMKRNVLTFDSKTGVITIIGSLRI